jgi:hypothetical protein
LDISAPPYRWNRREEWRAGWERNRYNAFSKRALDAMRREKEPNVGLMVVLARIEHAQAQELDINPANRAQSVA